MKRIIICCDGTWKRVDAAHPTNVVKLAKAVLPAGPDGVVQLMLHLDGVGCGRGTGWLARGLDRWLGGAFGLGLLDNIAEAYRFLVFNYVPGDEIYLFGYSRGAFTARSLAGLIRTCGIPPRAAAAAIPEALALYRRRGAEAHPDSRAALRFRARVAPQLVTSAAEAEWRAQAGLPAAPRLTIRYLGVWDTVGALGIPAYFGLPVLNRGLRFHDTRLSRSVQAARHAVAIDEARRSFPPTLWDNLAELNADGGGGAYAQRWFPGDHGSVGGGGRVTGLSDDALLWVLEGAVAAGLAVDPAAVTGFATTRDFRAPLAAAGRAGIFARLAGLGRAARRGPAAVADLAAAALARWRADPAYRPAPLRHLRAALDGGGA